ncbi:uncharacterized protein LOC122256690 [Penaeus japonicus]|uniref:uncharacterized protein LOC122256690 n=1 Tax=Penaeus japonicus TaxID=27405 RepID=UPI001C71770C|nr:uncharacterized protein LOC122256690 [Penaeus japonicus]
MASLRFTFCAVILVVLMAAVTVSSQGLICEVNYPKTGSCPSYLSGENYPANPNPLPPVCSCAHDRDCPEPKLCCVGEGGFRAACYDPE